MTNYQEANIVLVESLVEANKKLNEKILTEKLQMVSKEWLSYYFCDCLIEDFNFVVSLIQQDCNSRFIIPVVRNMTEQTIIYKYLMRHPKELESYYDGRYDTEKVWESEIENPEKELIKLTRRNVNGKSLSSMHSELIKKKKNKKSLINLYDIYSILSNQMHSAYFHSMVEEIGNLESEEDFNEELEEIKIFDLYMFASLKLFRDTYIPIVNRTPSESDKYSF